MKQLKYKLAFKVITLLLLFQANAFCLSESDIPDVGSYTSGGGANDGEDVNISTISDNPFKQWSDNAKIKELKDSIDPSKALGAGGGLSSIGSLGGWADTGLPGPSDFKVMMATDWGYFIKTWRVTGVGWCRKRWKFTVCVKIQHGYPTGIAEVIKRSGKTDLKSPIPMVFVKIMAKAASKAMKTMFGFGSTAGTGRGAGSSASESNFSFFNGYVYDYPDIRPWLEQLSKYYPYLKVVTQVMKRVMCNPQNPGSIKPLYSTESDFLAWRTGIADLGKVLTFKSLLSGAKGCSDTTIAGSDYLGGGKMLKFSEYCIGNYGPIYPRTGWATQYNEPTAAVVAAFRAFSLANTGGLVKLGKYKFTVRTGSYFQQLEPLKGKCYPLQGNYLKHPGYKKFDSKQNYMYIHFPTLECCSGCYGARQIQ
jgi:hypothetical protein